MEGREGGGEGETKADGKSKIADDLSQERPSLTTLLNLNKLHKTGA